MASIRRLEDGRAKPWQIRIRRKGTDVTEYFRTKREASEFASKVEADFDCWAKLLGGELRRHTVADLVDRYMSGYRGKDHNAPNRLAWWKEHFGDWTPSEFNADTVREALSRLATDPAPHGGKLVTETDKPRTGATINRYKAAVSSAFKAGIDGGWFGIKDNPFGGIRSRKEERGRFGRCLEDDERARLLAACDGSDWPGSVPGVATLRRGRTRPSAADSRSPGPASPLFALDPAPLLTTMDRLVLTTLVGDCPRYPPTIGGFRQPSTIPRWLGGRASGNVRGRDRPGLASRRAAAERGAAPRQRCS